MTRLRLTFMAALVVLSAAAAAQSSQRAALNPVLERHKDLVERFFAAVDAADLQTLRAVVGADYIEHASYAADGRDALLERATENAEVENGARRERVALVRMIGEGDQVWTYSRVQAAGTLMARIDMFRIDHDVIAEHWAVQETVNLQRANANDQWAVGKGAQNVDPQPKRVTKVVSAEELNRNKEVSRLFFQYAEAIDPDERRKLLDIATPAYIQHNAQGQDGIGGFVTRASPLPHHMNVRILAEGDFVWSLNVPNFAQGMRDGIERVNFNQWRLENGKLAEHWGTYESVPAARPNGNDVLGFGRTHTRDFTR